MITIQVFIFTAYITHYWNFNLKSISMSSYEHGRWGFLWFSLFMVAIAVPFVLEDFGKSFTVFGQTHYWYHIAAFFLIQAGLTHKHKTKGIKQVHHIVSTLAIICGFLAVGSWGAVGHFMFFTGIAYIVKRDQILWYLEIIAFYIITIYRV